MGDSFTTNIGGNGNTVGNTGSMSGGEITQNVVQGEHVEFATDAEAFKKLAEILKGFPGDDHDDDLMEAMQLKKAAEANDGKLPDPEHKSQAKKLWKKVAEPIAEKGSDIVAKALAEYFSKLTTG
jgi:hypothetical protein